jgi:hypothetical protein
MVNQQAYGLLSIVRRRRFLIMTFVSYDGAFYHS